MLLALFADRERIREVENRLIARALGWKLLALLGSAAAALALSSPAPIETPVTIVDSVAGWMP